MNRFSQRNRLVVMAVLTVLSVFVADRTVPLIVLVRIAELGFMLVLAILGPILFVKDARKAGWQQRHPRLLVLVAAMLPVAVVGMTVAVVLSGAF